jgi:hypothetical protein
MRTRSGKKHGQDTGQHAAFDLRPACLGGRWRDIAPGDQHLYIYQCSCPFVCTTRGIRVKGCLGCAGVRARIQGFGTRCPEHEFSDCFWVVDVVP